MSCIDCVPFVSPCDDPYPGADWDDLGEWEWAAGAGDGAIGREGLSPGWGFSGGLFYFVAAPDASGNDAVTMKLDEGLGTVDLFAHLQGGAFVINGTFTIPATTHIASQNAVVNFAVLFNNGAGGGVSWSYQLGNAGQVLLEDSITLVDLGPSITQRQVNATTAGTHSFAFHVSPSAARIVFDGGAELSLAHDPPWVFADLDRLTFQLGEVPTSSSGMIAGGTWNLGPLVVQRVDGTVAPWCPPGSGTGTPNQGQPIVNELAGVGDGTTTVFTTDYPYHPLSLQVEVDGILVGADPSDPTGQEFTLSYAPDTGEEVRVSYQYEAA